MPHTVINVYFLSTMKRINWGFIGCGEATEKKSGPAFGEVPGSQVVAVMSRNADKARLYAERHHIRKWYTDAQELIDDPDVDAIYIATPPSSHATFAIMAMRSGKPCYVEKPLAACYEDCLRINRISEQTGVPCFVAYYRRYLPYFQKVKELVEDGTLGKILNVQIRFSAPPREFDNAQGNNQPWRVQPLIAGGGYFYDLAPHQLDLLQQLFGFIIRAHGYPANRAHLYQAEDTISASFIFQSGIPGSASWCFVGHESAKEDRIVVIGDRGTLGFSVYSYDPISLITSEGHQRFAIPNPAHVQLPLIRAVVEHLQGEGVCECTSVSATPTNWVMDRILGKF